MAVYTDITEDELRDFMGAYDVGDILSYKGIAEGVENSNFLLHTSQAQFILTLYEKRVDKRDLPFFLGLMQHLSMKGLNCPLPVLRRDGALLSELAGRPAAVITFLDGMWPRRPTAHHCEAVGRAMAQLHLAAADFELSRANALGVDDWRPLWNKCQDGDTELEPGLTEETQACLDTVENAWPRDLPQGVIHADMFPDNVFFLGDDLSGIIDFYFACNDALAYDIAVGLNAWCFERDHSFNITKGQALLHGYTSVRPLAPKEAEAMPVLARGAALRFMLTRLYDWVNTPVDAQVVKKDPLEYMYRMRFHAAVDNASEYGLV
jgi:homoserine kinase type II